jgi:hypothetical protein
MRLQFKSAACFPIEALLALNHRRFIMKFIFIAALVFASGSAFATASACVTYLDASATPIVVQYSCDGSDLTKLFEASGMTAGISKSVSYFLNQGYSLNGCTDGFSPETSTAYGYAYARCVFIK